MNFGEINSQIQADISGLTQKLEVLRALNRVIRDINARFPGHLQVETGLTNSAGTLTASTDYTWDNTNKILTLPDYCKKLLMVFENNTELERRGFEFVKDSDNDDELAFAIHSRNKISLAGDLADTADDIIQIKMLKDFTVLTSSASSTTLDTPDQLDEVLLNGIRYYIYAKPAYRDDVLLKLSGEQYTEGLKAVMELEETRSPIEEADKQYKY